MYAVLSPEWLVIVTKCPRFEVHSTLTDLSIVPWYPLTSPVGKVMLIR